MRLSLESIKQAVSKPLSLALLAAVLCLTNLFVFYPGEMTYDSRQQYAEALSGHFTDWHPPITAWLWSHLLPLGVECGPLFVMNVFLYWLGFGLIAAALSRLGHMRAACGVVAVALLPVFFLTNHVVEKDVALAVSFLSAFALVFFYRSQDRRVPPAILVAVCVLMAYGCLVRANGMFAAAPLLIYMAAPRLVGRPVRFLAACLVICALAVPASGIFNHRVLHAAQSHPMRSLQLFDVTGVAYYSGDMSVFWPGPFTYDLVRRCYTPVLWDPLAHGDACHVFWDSPSPGQTKAWLSAIAHHPLAYAQHRLTHFNSEIEFIAPRHSGDTLVKNRILTGTPIVPPQLTPLQTVGDYLRYNALFAPSFALAIGFLLAGLSALKLRTGHTALTAATFFLALSGVVYTSAYLIVGVGSDFRYQYWSMLAVFTASVLFFADRSAEFMPLSRSGRRFLLAAALIFAVLQGIQLLEGNALTAG